jgi:hypothetical protein
MHTIEVLDEAVSAVKQLGYIVRLEWLDGGGGLCEFRGRRWIFVDLSQPAAEQLEEVLTVLRRDPKLNDLPVSPLLRRLCQPRRAA